MFGSLTWGRVHIIQVQDIHGHGYYIRVIVETSLGGKVSLVGRGTCTSRLETSIQGYLLCTIPLVIIFILHAFSSPAGHEFNLYSQSST